jgi:Rho termination factor-like protein
VVGEPPDHATGPGESGYDGSVRIDRDRLTTSGHWFPLAFDAPYQLAAMAVGVRPSRAGVAVFDHMLVAAYGPWVVVTPVQNVVEAEITGPYAWPKVIGPPHLSLKDRGLTFAGNANQGVCIDFRRPVRGIEPTGIVRHPNLTVTVAQPHGLIDALHDAAEQAEQLDDEVADEVERIDQSSHDELEGMTTSQLRELARLEGLHAPSSLRKAELVALIEDAEEQHGEAAAIDDAG